MTIRPWSVASTILIGQLQPLAIIPVVEYQTFFLLRFWSLWKHRHDMVFRGEAPSIQRLIQWCVEDATLWAERMSQIFVFCFSLLIVMLWSNWTPCTSLFYPSLQKFRWGSSIWKKKSRGSGISNTERGNGIVLVNQSPWCHEHSIKKMLIWYDVCISSNPF